MINTQQYPSTDFFRGRPRGVAMVAMVATSQKSHTMRVERSGRCRVVIPTCPHGEDHA